MVTSMRYLYPLIFVVLLALPGSMKAQDKKSAVVRTLSSEITGFVRYQDGETAVDELPIDIWDINREKYLRDWKAVTDKYGHYSIKPLPPGKYFIEYDKVRVELHIIEGPNVLVYQPHDIIVIIPQAVATPTYFVPMTVTAVGLINIPYFLYGQRPGSTPPREPPRPPGRPPVISP